MTAVDADGTPAADSPLVRVRDLSVTHEGASAPSPQEVSLDLRPGEVVLLLGPSGSGKSTLALTLDGLIPHDVPASLTGRVEVAGVSTVDSSVARLSTSVAMVFQDPDAQIVTGSVLDEVAFGPENLRVPASQVLARTEDALRRVGLWDRRADDPGDLSGGGRQRLAIAAALALGSPVLVLDEPTANLDPRGIADVYRTLGDLARDRTRAILLIEHNLDEAVGIVDRVVVLDRAGRVVADGPRDAILRGQAQHLQDLGVWLPTATLATLRLRRAGYALDPVPLTPDELHAALRDAPAVVREAPRTGTDAAASASRTADPVIEVRDLTLRRGRTDVLHGVSLDVARGEFLALVGANGAGKTTLLQAMAGVLPASRGAVRIDGADLSRMDARSIPARIGFVFQNPEHQFIASTVFDEIAHGLRRQGIDPAHTHARTMELLARFGLEDKADVHPFLLSGGQKRRLSVGTALVAGAPVLALDEPTFGQDRSRAEELLTLLDDLNRAGTTIMVVTHDMQVVAEHADRVAVVDGGRIAAIGPTAEVFADAELLHRTGLRPPPLRRALQGLPQHPELAGITRLRDLPGDAT